MRLTLRTLLAWIDGVLPGSQQDELGEKVAASQVAPKLVARIRDVVGRPGLAAPRVDGQGLAEDPNTVAEFLDNALPADRLEAFERICIESDIHLAEVADCHAMLAELATDSAAAPPLGPQLRRHLIERLAAFVVHPPQDAAHEEAAALVKAVQDAVARESRPSRPGAAGDPAAEQSGRKASWAAWLSAGLAIVLLGVLAGLLGWSLTRPGRGVREVAVAGPPPAVRPAAEQPPVDPSAPVEPPPQEPRPVDRAQLEESRPEDARPEAARTAAGDPASGGGPPAAAVVVPLPQMERAGGEPDERPTEDPFGEPLADPRPAGGPEKLAADPGPPLGMVAEGGALLHRVRDGDEGRWAAVEAGARLAAVEEFLVPLHAYPRIVRGEISIRLQPGTQAALTGDGDGTPRLEVVFGGAVVWTEAAEATVGITAGGLSGVAAVGPGQEIGVAVDLLRSGGDDPAVAPPGRRARLHTVGGVGWRQTAIDGGPPGELLNGLPVEQPLPPRGGIEWTSGDPAAARLLPVATLPAWIGRREPAGRPERNAAAALARAVAEDRPVDESLRALAGDRRVENRAAAVATLALLGDYGELVELLCEDRPGLKLSDSQWLDLQAATVPLALARGANAAAKLRQAFLARGPTGRGEELFRLARGLSPAEAAAGGAAALVERLADDQLAVRRYAQLELLRLFPDDPAGRLDYRPDRSATLNERGVEWWRRTVAAAAPPPAAP